MFLIKFQFTNQEKRQKQLGRFESVIGSYQNATFFRKIPLKMKFHFIKKFSQPIPRKFLIPVTSTRRQMTRKYLQVEILGI